MFSWFENGQLIWNWPKIVTEIRYLQKLLHLLPQGADRIDVHNRVSGPGSCPVTHVLRNGFSISSLRDSTSESNSLSQNISSHILRFSLPLTLQHSSPLVLVVVLSSLPGEIITISCILYLCCLPLPCSVAHFISCFPGR